MTHTPRLNTIPDPKQVLLALGIRPRKRLSQNFLVDTDIRDAMVRALNVSPGESVLEIGAGTGVLTEALVDCGAQVVAVEKDPVLAGHLKERFGRRSGIRIVEADFLRCTPRDLELPSATRVIANLPYHITTPVLFHLAEHRAYFSDLWITMQREVARRILASPGGKDYGVLTLNLALWFEAHLVLSISRKAFHPSPKVESAFVSFHTLKKLPVQAGETKFFQTVVRTAFQKRRKQAINALIPLVGPEYGKVDIQKLFIDSGLDPFSRAERLSMNDFIRLAKGLQNMQKTTSI